MKNTKQKQAILEAVNTMKTHPTADEIYYSLKKHNERLSLGTVYRNLNTFAENGDIKKISVPGYGDRFDFRTDNHEHMLCETCGRVSDVEARLDLEDILSRNPGVSVSGYKLMLYGVCAGCGAEKQL